MYRRRRERERDYGRFQQEISDLKTQLMASITSSKADNAKIVRDLTDEKWANSHLQNIIKAFALILPLSRMNCSRSWTDHERIQVV